MVDNKKYLQLFISEAREHLDSMDTGLISLEKSPGDSRVIKELMRHAHTLKGIAATVGYGEISNLTHSFEGMVENIKNKIASGSTDLLFGAVDELRKMVDDAESDSPDTMASPLVDQIGELETEDLKKDAEILESPKTLRSISEVKVRTEKLDKLMEITSELMLSKQALNSCIEGLPKDVQEILVKSANLVEDLQYQVLQLRLTPVGQVFNRFPRMIRDLAKKLDKEINFEVFGSDIEIDRSVLDGLGEPIVHLLRNAADHGIEKKGQILLKAAKSEDMVKITVSDDGKGINWDKLRDKAQVGKDVSDEDVLFSGVSTADSVTDVSGRGVGLYTVKNRIEKLGGRVAVESAQGSGTTFELLLPVSMSIIQALLIDVAESVFAIPLSNVNRLIRLSDVEIKSQLDTKVAIIDNSEVPLILLSEVLNLRSDDSKQVFNNSMVVLLAQMNDEQYGFLADEVISQQDIVVKQLQDSVRQNVGFSSVTILEKGELVPILDFSTLV